MSRKKKPPSYSELMKAGRKLLDSHGLQDWRISIENLENTALYGPRCIGTEGLCDHENKTIRVDSLMRRSFRQTLLHEIAHALTPADKSHGDEWLKKAEEFGCTSRHLWPYYLANEKRKRGGGQ